MIHVGSQCVTPEQSGQQPKEMTMMHACSTYVTCMLCSRLHCLVAGTHGPIESYNALSLRYCCQVVIAECNGTHAGYNLQDRLGSSATV